MTIKVGSMVYTENGIGHVSAISHHRWNTMFQVEGTSGGFSGFYSEADVQEMTSEDPFMDSLYAPDVASPQLPYDLDGILTETDPQTSTLIPGGEPSRGITVNSSNDFWEDERPEEIERPLYATKKSAWKDVQAKALRLINDGKVKILSRSEDFIRAKVQGDNGVYTTIVSADIDPIEDSQEYGFSCSCPWSKTFTRDRKVDLHLADRLCAHALAVSMEMKENYGKTAATTSEDYNDSGLGEPKHELLEFDGNDHTYDVGELWGENFDQFEELPEELKNNIHASNDEDLDTQWRFYKSAQEMDEEESSITPVRMTASQSLAAEIPNSISSRDVVAAFQSDADWLMAEGLAGDVDQDLSTAAEAHLAKIAGRAFSPAERAALISEGEDEVLARNLHSLDISATHYALEEGI